MRRRDFIKGLGGLSALGLLPGLGGSLAFAESEAPKRFLLLSHCHGWPYDSWKMHPSDTALNVAQRWELSSFGEAAWSQALRPLYRHRQRLNVIDGLSLASAELDLDGNRHDTGWIHAWTGAQADFSGTDTRSVSASIDQLIARSISRNDRLPSLELALNDAQETGRPVAYSPAGSRLPVETVQHVCGVVSLDLECTRSSDDPATRGSGIRLSQWRLSSRVSPAQRQKLQAHFELVNGLADRIEGAQWRVRLHRTSVCCGRCYGERFDLLSDLIATHSPAMQLGLWV